MENYGFYTLLKTEYFTQTVVKLKKTYLIALGYCDIDPGNTLSMYSYRNYGMIEKEDGRAIQFRSDFIRIQEAF